MHCSCILVESIYKPINCTFPLLMKKGPKMTHQEKIKMQNAPHRVQGSTVQFRGIPIHVAHYMYIAKHIPNLVSSDHKNTVEKNLRSYSSGTTNGTFDLV